MDKFLNNEKGRIFIGAEYGVGKSTYAKNLAMKAVEKFRNFESTWLPIFVELDKFDQLEYYL